MPRENLDRYALAARIHDLLAPELGAEGWDLVDVRVFRGGGRLQVRLYVDLPGEERIDLDGCARASRAASMFLEESDLFPEAWVLEVSSPGIRRPLRVEAHFAAAVGRNVELKWRPLDAPTSRPQSLRGRLDSVTDGVLTVTPAVSQDGGAATESEPMAVPIAAVLEANLDHEFDAQAVIREDRRQRKEDRRNKRAARKKARGKKSGGRNADHDSPAAQDSDAREDDAPDVDDQEERDGS